VTNKLKKRIKMKRKIGIITGGSRGLGKNMALNIAAQGSNVIITYHTRQG
jgi:NAD(P)-dependent dehydrogenase (short-subunit alcohol dehydrogenase family)